MGGMHRSLAIVALVGFTLPLLLLISKLVKMWRRSREGWTAVANPDQLMPLDNSETARRTQWKTGMKNGARIADSNTARSRTTLPRPSSTLLAAPALVHHEAGMVERAF